LTNGCPDSHIAYKKLVGLQAFAIVCIASSYLVLVRRAAAFAHAIPREAGALARPLHRVERHTLGWEPDEHRRPLAGPAFNREGAAMKLREPARQRKPEPRPLEPLYEAVVDLAEGFERALDLPGGHADAGIGDCDAQARLFVQLGGERDAALRRGELHGVREKIEGDLPQPFLISDDRYGTRGEADRQIDLLVLGLGLDGADGFLDDGRKALPGLR